MRARSAEEEFDFVGQWVGKYRTVKKASSLDRNSDPGLPAQYVDVNIDIIQHARK